MVCSEVYCNWKVQEVSFPSCIIVSASVCVLDGTFQYVVGGLGSDRILFPIMRGTRIKFNELNEESGQNPEI